MIISVSRRTDIPAYYSKWFVNRIAEEYVYVRNPMNARQISNIKLNPSVIDGFVFLTKNPIPMMDQLDVISNYPYYFQFTLTSYGRDIEPGLPSKNQDLIPAFCKLSERIGKERVVWRYDPIFITDTYNVAYHKQYFRVLASKLGKYTEKCTISFLDMYKSIAKNTRQLGIRIPTTEEQLDMMAEFAIIAKEYGFYIDTCAEEIDLSELEIRHACCIDRERLERIGNYRLKVTKDMNQRAACGCISSIDIGAYDTCNHKCVYCYANHSAGAVRSHILDHNPQSPLLFGNVEESDKITDRVMTSQILY